MRGAHLIKFWSKTQGLVALSSAEAELYGCVKATAEAIGLTSLFRDLGSEIKASVMTDASATLSMIKKKGLGKARHIQTNYLWIQDVNSRNELGFSKVPGADNCSDVLTKYVNKDLMEKHAVGIAYNPTSPIP